MASKIRAGLYRATVCNVTLEVEHRPEYGGWVCYYNGEIGTEAYPTKADALVFGRRTIESESRNHAA